MRRNTRPAGYVAVTSTGILAILLAVGGPFYVTGVLSTTLARATGGSSPLMVLIDAAKWIGPACLLAALAVAMVALAHHDRFQLTTFALLAAAGLLAPVNQARLATIMSSPKLRTGTGSGRASSRSGPTGNRQRRTAGC